MGYYSDVALTLCKGNAVEMVRKAKIECESAYRTLSAAKIVDHDEYVSFLWHGIKWYHFDDVVFITNFWSECNYGIWKNQVISMVLAQQARGFIQQSMKINRCCHLGGIFVCIPKTPP